MDFDHDGFDDIVASTYYGKPLISFGSPKGFSQPEFFQDQNGKPIELLKDHSEWDGENQCVSAVAFDWDGDQDYDLLLGAHNGKLFLRMNEGTKDQAKFASPHRQIEAGGMPFQIEGRMTAPRIVDWDQDNVPDLVCGSCRGGIYLYRNSGKLGQPEFEKPVTLIAALENPESKPMAPTGRYYADPVDIDGDGDLDLLVGADTEWTPPPPELTDAQKKRLESLEHSIAESSKALEALEARVAREFAEQDERAAHEALRKESEYHELRQRLRDLGTERGDLVPYPRLDSGLWLFIHES